MKTLLIYDIRWELIDMVEDWNTIDNFEEINWTYDLIKENLNLPDEITIEVEDSNLEVMEEELDDMIRECISNEFGHYLNNYKYKFYNSINEVEETDLIRVNAFFI